MMRQIIYTLLIFFTAWSHTWAGGVVFMAGGTPTSTYTYSGYSNSNGVPSSTPSSAHASSGVDRTIVHCETATANGIADAINVYIGSTWNPPTNAQVVFYQQDGSTYDLGGSATLSGVSASAWTGYVELSGSDLSYSAGDAICYGISIQAGADANGSIGFNSGGSSDEHWTGAYLPTENVSFSVLADRDVAAILRSE